MSKAFTKEDAGGDEELRAPEAPLPQGAAYVTRAGYDKLRAELDRLWHEERPKVTADVQAAAAMGDRSENAEYIYGKKRLREIDGRIRFLSKRLEALTVVEGPPAARDRVFFGAWVTIEDEEGVESTYRIVGPDESDSSRGLISVASPLARALLGKRRGDDALVRRPAGPTEVTVTGIRYE
jgi:transcription elongation factor GreB